MKVLVATEKPFAAAAVNGIRDIVEGAGHELALLEKYTEKEQLLEYKRKLSDKISDILAKQKLPGRTCKDCGRPIPWNYPYGICQSCYNNRYIYVDYDYDYYL